MKKILLLSSAVALTAGAALAESGVSFEGLAEMGVAGGKGINDGNPFDAGGVSDPKTEFYTELELTILMSAVTDGGIEFGASVDLSDAIGGDIDDGRNQAGQAIYISGDFGTVTMGDTDGSFDQSTFEYVEVAGVGTIDDAQETTAFGGSDLTGDLIAVQPLDSGLDGLFDGQIARYDYTIEGFSVNASVEMDDEGESDPVIGVGATYEGEFSGTKLQLGAAYQSVHLQDYDATAITGNADVYGVSGVVALPMGLEFRGTVSQTDIDISDNTGAKIDTDFLSYGLGLGYAVGAVKVGASYGILDIDSKYGDQVEGYALVVDYDLGGGLALQAGYAYNDFDDESVYGEDYSRYSFGVAMSF